MSTKTTFKRVALVAVAALGLGGLSTVSAHAVTGQTAASVVVGSIPASRVGQVVYVPVKAYLPSAAVATDTMTVNVETTSAPIMGGAANAASKFNSGTSENDAGALLSLTSGTSDLTTFTNATPVRGRLAVDRSYGAEVTATHTNIGVAAATSGSYVIQASDVAKGYVSFNVAVTPDVAGSYSFLVSTNAVARNKYTAGDSSATLTITPGGTVASVAFSTPAGATIVSNSTNGIPVYITLTGGALSGLDSIQLSTTGLGTICTAAGSGCALTQSLVANNFAGGSSAKVWLRDTGTAAETISLIATAGGTATFATVSQTFSVKAQAGDATNYLTIEAPSSTATYAMTSGVSASGSTYTVPLTSTSQAIGFTTPALTAAAAAAAGTLGYVTVTDSLGKLTGKSGLVYDVPLSVAFGTTAAGGTLSYAASAAGLVSGTTLFTVAFPAKSANFVGTNAGDTITFVTGTASASSFSITPNSTFLAAPGASLALTAKLKDNFGNALPYTAVTVTTTGRNNPAATALVTDASGKVYFTTADASTSTTSLTDSVVFTSSGATASTVTINYSNTAVGKVTVTGGNTTASVANATPTINPISAGDGAEAGAVGITATVKDALGNALTGVPVTFSVAGTGVAIPSNGLIKYSGTTGTASTTIYAWIAGTYTYTVTAGGVSTTGTISFADTTAANARTISVAASGNTVTATVKDRFGNPVSGSTVYIKTAGGANVGGAFQTSGTTLSDGTVSWVVSGSGTATVYSNLNPSAVAGTNPSDQSCALAGNLTCASGATAAVAFTASTVGTATTAETGVGASIAPAGVNSASVTVAGNDQASIDAAQAAQDAANEATDAANAATDAANNAMDSADAATAAAQDAGDKADAALAAITDLATKVSDIATQVSSLSAVVAKIAAAVAKISAKVKA